MDIFLPLIVTLVFEVGIYMILKHKDFKLFMVTSLANILLNVTMNLGLSLIEDRTIYYVVLSICEVGTVLFESLVVFLFMRFKYLKVLLFAFLANLTSFLIGIALWPVYDIKIATYIVSGVFLIIYLVMYSITFVSFYRSKHNFDRNNSKD